MEAIVQWLSVERNVSSIGEELADFAISYRRSGRLVSGFREEQ